MPINTSNPIAIIDPATPYQRLAFRGSLSASVVSGAFANANLALHVTTYRKITTPSGDEIEEVGSPRGIRGITMAKGDNPIDDALMGRISTNCVSAVLGAGSTADIQVNFNWRSRAGDIVGLVHATITQPGGKPTVQIACGDVAAWDQEYPQFAMAYGDALAALGEWIAAKGW